MNRRILIWESRNASARDGGAGAALTMNQNMA